MEEEKLFETCWMQVYSYVCALSHDRELSEAITQEAFTRVMRKSPEQYELSYLCTVAKNLFIDETRRRKHLAELPDDIAAESGFEQKVEDEDAAFRIFAVLHTLEEPYKEVFQLRVFGELSFKKIGALFGRTENWARVTYHRAALRIRERMDENG